MHMLGMRKVSILALRFLKTNRFGLSWDSKV